MAFGMENMSTPARWATVIGGGMATGYVLYARHKKTGAWNPFSAGTPAADNATPDASVASAVPVSPSLGSDSGGGTGMLAAVPTTGASADLSTSSPYTLNATYPSTQQWAQAAQAGLTSIGYDPQTVGQALGDYVSQTPLDASEESIVRTAVAEYGTPTGPNGMPLQILAKPAVAPITSTGGSAPSIKPAQPAAVPKSTILTGGHVVSSHPSHAEVAWTIRQASPHTARLMVVITGYRKKDQVRYIPATATTASFSDLAPKHTYTVSVTPLGKDGQADGGPNHIDLVTSAK